MTLDSNLEKATDVQHVHLIILVKAVLLNVIAKNYKGEKKVLIILNHNSVRIFEKKIALLIPMSRFFFSRLVGIYIFLFCVCVRPLLNIDIYI